MRLQLCLIFKFVLILVGCGGSNPADSLFTSDTTYVEVPVDSGELSISINYPISNGKKVSYQAELSGVCGAPT